MVPSVIDRFLRDGGRRAEASTLDLRQLILAVCVCSGSYGAVMASYDGLAGDRWLMTLYGALKVPLLFVVTLALAIPAFYTVNMLAGVGADFAKVRRALVDYQLSVSIQLLSFLPVTVMMNLTVESYAVLQLWSAVVFAVAAWQARQSLTRCYTALERKRPVHRWLRRLWFLFYTFVGVQMGWTLRPFLGKSGLPAQFFRDDIGNAYVQVGQRIWRAVLDLLG